MIVSVVTKWNVVTTNNKTQRSGGLVHRAGQPRESESLFCSPLKQWNQVPQVGLITADYKENPGSASSLTTGLEDTTGEGSTSGQSLPPAKSLPRMTATPGTGKEGRTPMATSDALEQTATASPFPLTRGLQPF
ncbi:hypothetical protein NQZ68_000466 [Dissostichus eleginoides]|nr:hypothetical protein NQZ68_000466 [Dissostichus eleginoides]